MLVKRAQLRPFISQHAVAEAFPPTSQVLSITESSSWVISVLKIQHVTEEVEHVWWKYVWIKPISLDRLWMLSNWIGKRGQEGKGKHYYYVHSKSVLEYILKFLVLIPTNNQTFSPVSKGMTHLEATTFLLKNKNILAQKHQSNKEPPAAHASKVWSTQQFFLLFPVLLML